MPENDTTFVEIYTETTPNPKTLKFNTNHVLLPNMIFEAKNSSETTDSPLAAALFEFSFVEAVFISNNFVTLTKNTETDDWFEHAFDLKPFIKQYILDGKPIVTPGFIEQKKEEKANRKEGGDIESKIKDLLEKYVKPAVEMDGGYISFKSFDNGVVTLALQGSCSGCPSASVTLKDGIQGLLQRMLPEVTEVVAESEEV